MVLYGKDLRIRKVVGRYRVHKESIRYAQKEYCERGGNQKGTELRTRRQGCAVVKSVMRFMKQGLKSDHWMCYLGRHG